MEARSKADDAEASLAGAAVPPGGPSVARSSYTPLFRAQHEDRYLRQRLIAEYEAAHDCRFVALIDQITDESVTLFAEVLHDVPGGADLHLMLCSPGGDPEVAIRLARMAQGACDKFIVLVPDTAKSAATVLALGADRVIMGPTSDLGPIDPQVLIEDRGYVSAKDLIAAVDKAITDVSEQPDTYPLIAAMLAGIDVTTVQFARSAMNRTSAIARQALESNPHRSARQVAVMVGKIEGALIAEPASHSAVIGAHEARKIGLPVRELKHTDPHWSQIWELWTKYFTLGELPFVQVYEGVRASQVRVRTPGGR